LLSKYMRRSDGWAVLGLAGRIRNETKRDEIGRLLCVYRFWTWDFELGGRDLNWMGWIYVVFI
jgi:hypothetical protein